jgi:hypothetical protein
MGPV